MVEMTPIAGMEGTILAGEEAGVLVRLPTAAEAKIRIADAVLARTAGRGPSRNLTCPAATGRRSLMSKSSYNPT
jgi:hypothetical protein